MTNQLPARLSDLTEMRIKDARASAFVHMVCARASSSSTSDVPDLLERRLGGRAAEIIDALGKAAVAPIGTVGVAPDLSPFGRAFIEAKLSGRSAFDSLDFTPAPANVRVAVEDYSTAAATWVDEGARIPMTRFTTEQSGLPIHKLGLITVLSRTLAVAVDPTSVQTVEDMLVRIITAATDATVFDVTDSASLAYGATAIVESEDRGDDVRAVLAALSSGRATRPALVLGTAAARTLAFSGIDTFRNVALAGTGSIAGVPAVVSPSAALAERVIGVDLDGVLVADLGLDVDRSGHATLQMDDAPASGALTSLFQQDLVGLRVVRWLGWATRADAFAYTTISTGSPS